MPPVKIAKSLKAKLSKTAPNRLPNAHLTEVVFELRWKVPGRPSVPTPFRIDPGYYVFADRFESQLERDGYLHHVVTAEMPTAGTIERRHYKSSDHAFPL